MRKRSGQKTFANKQKPLRSAFLRCFSMGALLLKPFVLQEEAILPHEQEVVGLFVDHIPIWPDHNAPKFQEQHYGLVRLARSPAASVRMAYREQPGRWIKALDLPETIRCTLGCCCCGWVVTIGCLFGMYGAGDFLRKAEAWEVRPAWRQTECEVLAAGVSCADTETRSTCGGYPLGSMPSTSPPVFLTEDIAVCPGTYWCGKEQDVCHCNGEITYAPELFDGQIYTVPEADRAYKVVSSGPWKCGTDQNGEPYAVDPAPWHVKHCWCTPAEILAILKKHGGQALHKKECAEAANFDFDAAKRRLQREPGEDLEAEPRLLASSRRRRTFSYTPWALVSVPTTQDLDFGDAPSNRQLTCAYEFGVPAASSANYQSDGTYSGDVWLVEDVAKEWGNKTSRPCWVRAAGEAGESLQTCAVALLEPGILQEVAKGSQTLMTKSFWVFLGISLVLSLLAFPSLYRLVRRLTGGASSSETGCLLDAAWPERETELELWPHGKPQLGLLRRRPLQAHRGATVRVQTRQRLFCFKHRMLAMAEHEPFSLLSAEELPGTLQPQQVRVTFHSQNDRKAHSSDSRIEEIWTEAVTKNSRIYDGSKFRLQGVSWSRGLLQVDLGLTGYKEYLGTLVGPWRSADSSRSMGSAAHFSQALGCEAVLATADGQAVLLRRSGAVGTNSGLYNGPSGHPEPKNVSEAPAASASSSSSIAVQQELFRSVVDEAVAETNVPRESLAEPELMGFMADSTGKPDVLFLLRTSFTSEEVQLAYSKGAEEAWESDRLTFWPLTKLHECSLPLTAVTRAAIACLQLHSAKGDRLPSLGASAAMLAERSLECVKECLGTSFHPDEFGKCTDKVAKSAMVGGVLGAGMDLATGGVFVGAWTAAGSAGAAVAGKMMCNEQLLRCKKVCQYKE
ncbi:Nudt22 [Symbiodinium microadriaticum]|nr:Nudt22 [Symbiodinium microadriaticum]